MNTLLYTLIIQCEMTIFSLAHMKREKMWKTILYVLISVGICTWMEVLFHQKYYYDGLFALALILIRMIFMCLYEESFNINHLIFLFVCDGLQSLGNEVSYLYGYLSTGFVPLMYGFMHPYFSAVIANAVFVLTASFMIPKTRKYREYHSNQDAYFAFLFCISFVIRVYVENLMYQEETFLVQLILINTSIFLLTFFLYDIFCRTSKAYFENTQRNYLAAQLKSIASNTELYAENEKKIRTMRHDLKNQFVVLDYLLTNENLAECRKVIHEQIDSLEKTNIVVNTGIAAVDALLTAKIVQAQQLGIHVQWKVHLSSLGTKESYDVAMVLGNLLDNAMENIAEETKEIRIAMEQKEQLIIQIENTTDETTLNLKTKKKGENHGLGLRSVQTIVDQHNGMMVMDCKDGIFSTLIKINCCSADKAA